MNKRVFKIRLIAWILCCVCLVTMIPTSAMAFETERLQTTETVESTETISGVTETQISAETTEITIEETETANTTEEDDVETVVLETEMLETELTTEEAETESSETTETEEVTTETEAIQETSEAETETTEENVETETSETETTEVADEAISLYEELMLADTCEQMYKLLQAEENQDAVLMLTVDELTSLQTRANAMEDDGWKEDVLEVLDMLIAIANGEGKETDLRWNGTTTFNVTNSITNAEVAYVNYTGSATDINSITFTKVANNETVTKTASSGVLIFFLKPADGYLLTQYKDADGSARDLYGITVAAADSNIRWFKNNPTTAQAILNKATAQGYLGYYAFTYMSPEDKNYSYSANYTVEGQRPEMEVTAVANPNTNLKPGDKVTFTVTITPGDLPGVDAERYIESIELTINSKGGYTATRDENGTYSVTGGTYSVTDGAYATFSVEYEITEDDWKVEHALLNANAKITYKYAIGVKDRTDLKQDDILTETTIEASASTDCEFASKQGVVYTLNYSAPEKISKEQYPDAIKTAPIDENEYFSGDKVSVITYGTEPVNDLVNGGTWEFDGWYLDGEKTGDTVTMVNQKLLLKGTWTFKEYPNANLTIKKTVSGNMQDPEKEFAFTIIANKNMTYSTVTENGTVTKVTDKIEINLKKDQEVTISVPRGATVTVSEDASGYTYSIGKDTTIVIDEEFENGIKFTMPNEDSTVVFNNDKSITLDTGIVLDTLPYIVILILVAGGAVLLFKKRQDREDD